MPLQMHKPHGPQMHQPHALVPMRTTETERMRGGRWSALRAQVMARDQGICQCGTCKLARTVEPAHALPAHEVDHIVALEDGGSDDSANLQAINRDCHVIKTRADNARRRGAAG
jgi:5-methylcytosine-specific restriction enzyme A